MIINYIIVGSGVAAISALKEILKSNSKETEITVISKDTYPFYYRPRLIECLSGKISVEDIIIHDRKWFTERGVNILLGKKVVKLNPEEGYLKTEKDKYYYDKLLLAQGGVPFIPPIKGINRENIFTLRNARNAESIGKTRDKVNKTIVVGCGLLGLEAAYNLKQAGLEVTMVEIEGQILPKQLDQQGAEILQKTLEDRGLKFRSGVMVEEFAGEDIVEGVKLNTGESIKTEMVTLNTGIRCNLDFAKGINGLEINKGIVVNKYMETSLDNIYAAGDVANFKNHLYGLWKPAQRQGLIA